MDEKFRVQVKFMKKTDMIQTKFWNFYRPTKCDYCDKAAVGILKASGYLWRKQRDLCEDHYKQWVKGELSI